MNIAQFGQQIKAKHPEYNDLPDEEVGSKMLTKYPQYKDMVDDPTEGAFTRGVEKTGAFDIPVVGGILRGLGTPLLKGAETVAEGGHALEEIVHGKTGQPFKPMFIGQAENKNLSGDFGQATSEALKTGAGAASYFVPGGGFVGGTTTKGLMGAGAASGFANSGDNPQDEALDTILGGILGPISAKVGAKGTKLLGKAVSAPTETLFGKIPAKLRADVALTNKKIENLTTAKLSDMVGYENIGKAKQLGITANHMPEDVISTVTPEMEKVGGSLDDFLNRDYANTTLADVKEAFTKAQRQVTPGTKDVDLHDFQSRVDDFLRQNVQDELSKDPQMQAFIAKNGPEALDTTPIPLAVVNKIKVRLGERFNDDPLYKQAYKNLQKLIEENSGHDSVIKSLNSEYNSLREIKQNAEKQIEKGLSSNVLNYDTKKQELMSHPLTDPSLGAGAAAMSGGLALAGPVGAIPGGTFALYRLLSNLFKDPKFAMKAADILEKPQGISNSEVGQAIGKGSDASGKLLQKIMEQAGVRLPGQVLGGMQQ